MVPAMAEYSIIAMMLMVKPPMIDGTASLSWAVRMICSRDPPDARATWTTAGGTERSEFSTIRVKNAMPASDIGTTAAAMPMLVPVMNRVNGMIDAIRMRNGRDRPMLMIQLNVVCRAGFSNRPP